MTRDYREKDVDGMIFKASAPLPKPCKITVRMTSDKLGQTLSLTGGNTMLVIPLEKVRDIIRVAESEENK